ncbi:MAG: hypothetical protein JSV09_13190 [Thermoplasmata archaeon]|nr:MAG: hypothetical protein JSV09_13190 [Thermoplasmata archaeon]
MFKYRTDLFDTCKNGGERENLRENGFGTIGAVDLPWTIEHVNVLLVGVILLTPIVAIAFLISISFPPLMILIILGFIFWAILLNKYKQAKRYSEIVFVLYRELVNVKILRGGPLRHGTLKVSTKRHGEFSLYYFPGHTRPGGGPFYKLWISTSKWVPVREGEKGYIWVRPSFLKLGLKADPNLAKYLSNPQIMNIGSLHRIQFENENGEGRIVSYFRDLLANSETMDILRTLVILWDIEARL